MRCHCAAVVLGVLAAPAFAETHYVKMLNGNDLGGMVFDPEFVTAEPGDTIRFLATQRGHNAATIGEFLPEGAEPFFSQINEEIEVTLTEVGFYGVKCSPHYDMGMVMLIRIGSVDLSEISLPDHMPGGATERFEAIIDRASQ